MKIFRHVWLANYVLNRDLLIWWLDSRFCVWQANDGFYLSIIPGSEKYKVADTFEGLVEYLKDLKENESEE